ncbi:MAG: MarR family transcriptional regulator [Bacillota bacterium]|nr:MarR family transcriptional regulator [Bacillota bacterium]
MKDFTKEFNSIIADAYHSLLLMEETKKKYSNAGFSFRDRNTITYLRRHGEGVKISDIAEYLKISRPSATSLVKKLERNGLVEKVTDAKNERNTLVSLTRKGRLFHVFQKRYRDRLADKVCEGFSDKEKEVLYEGFSRLNDFFLESIKEAEDIHKT